MRRLLLSVAILGCLASAVCATPPRSLRPTTLVPRATPPQPIAEEPAATVDQRTEEESDDAPTRWSEGYVHIEGDWLKFDEATERFEGDSRLANYRRFRGERWPDTIGGQWEAARWCTKNHLPEQRRAHLNRVLAFDPDSLEARSLLGHRRVGDRWLTADEVNRANLEARAAADAMKKWKPQIVDILADLTHRSQIRREQGAQRLAEIDDPAAVAAMESVLATQSEAIALGMIQTFDGISAPQAAVGLTRQAILSPHKSVRKAAVEALKKREYETYVPLLLGLLTTPIQSRLSISQAPGQGLAYRHELYREGQDTRHLMQISANYTRVAPDLSDYGRMADSLEAAVRQADRRDMVRNATARAQAVAMAATAENDRIHESNERICAILSKATGQFVPPTPESWWQWWYTYNDVFVSDFKPVVTEARHDRVIVASDVPEAVFSPMADNRPETGPSESSEDFQPWQEVDRESRSFVARGASSWQIPKRDCLAAGTQVWTELGAVAIEQITVGDLVLSQDVQTGELAYKPVLQTTLRPIGPLLKIDVDGQSIQTSGGHPFWVSGVGWTKARDLQPGSQFHAVAATAPVGPIAGGLLQETHNLVVADFHTYFIGEAKVLTHDNTIPQRTGVVAPGLIAP